ncbi:MAG: DUF3160 domain-containing protein [Lachnospiraceae bacterium]|nr:DUF3160 domain-containing protein [Lachnospiraceae bacterium]
MICPNCNHKNEDGAIFCGNCGTKLEDAAVTEKPEEKKSPAKAEKGNNRWIIPVVIGAVVFVVLVSAIIAGVAVISYRKLASDRKEVVQEEVEEQTGEDNTESDPFEEEKKESKSQKKALGKSDKAAGEVESLERASIIPGDAEQYYDGSLVPKVPDYAVKPDLSDVFNQNDIEYLPEDAKKKLAGNQFVVMNSGGLEFYDIYESNRYSQTPNFVTVDSMMHTYHIYFAYLLKKIEKEDLYDELRELSDDMYSKSVEQYKALEGSEWERAALRNVAFFTIGSKLLGDEPDVLPKIKGVVADELDLIDEGAVSESPLFDDFEDYSQYKPRGYYAGDKTLEKYFRGMMWYGRRAFEQKNEDHMRSALLMTLAMKEAGLNRWEGIYTVTSFFAGASDDNTYYEFEPAVEAAYGRIDDVTDLIGDDAGFNAYYDITSKMDAPQINSIPVWETDEENVITSFRFMGQRFSIDASIFQKLMYRSVEENSDGDKRMLPDALDIPAALGSQKAYEILDRQGDTDYKNYPEKMQEIKEGLEEQEDGELWNASLYAQWLNTLRPILTEKGKGYPSFMQSEEWNTRSLEGFLGSYAELKHDTILYSKQAMAEMGGGWDEEIDDRGYVEPEPVIYSRFAVLAENTMNGLKDYGMLDKDDKENLKHMADLAKQLVVISEKELKDEKLTDEEYLLIKDFGGDIEHLWADATREDDDGYPRSDEHPGAVIADVATDPNGSVLEIGTGRADDIYVICPVDGTLRACRGAVYSFYEFEWPMSDRLTDEEWRIKLGIWPESGYEFNKDESITQPAWTRSYRSEYEWDY